MNNKALLAVVVILLIGIFAVLGINAQSDGDIFATLVPSNSGTETSNATGSIQNNQY